MAAQRSLADRYRLHRQAFELALELGITPREAEAEMRRIEARERDRAAADRLASKLSAPLAPAPVRAKTPRFPEPWMMRD